MTGVVTLNDSVPVVISGDTLNYKVLVVVLAPFLLESDVSGLNVGGRYVCNTDGVVRCVDRSVVLGLPVFDIFWRRPHALGSV